MEIDYTVKRNPQTEGVYNTYLRVPANIGAGKSVWSYLRVTICMNCKKILGSHTE